MSTVTPIPEETVLQRAFEYSRDDTLLIFVIGTKAYKASVSRVFLI